MGVVIQQESTFGSSYGRVDRMSWRTLNEVLMKVDEQSVLKLLEDELKGRRRKTYILRLHKRYNILRVRREREEFYK